MGNAVESKQKILNAAEKLFAKKGFDGARVSEIASEAGVNKALIYYYFNSKEDILESLFAILIDDIKILLKNSIARFDFYGEDDFDKILNIILDYIISKKDILRVAMTESMKAVSEQSIIIKIGEMLISAEVEEMKQSLLEKGIESSGNIKEVLVVEFFTGTLPVLNYVIFEDEFTHHFNMDEEEFREYFINAFKQTHFAYHLKKR
ncbi:MAG: TetR/AcrR family transcriptional regulator [Firmicutes bacterium]|nr:TetR/AcrR family transcriptional regulator [Bacillota bacterium]